MESSSCCPDVYIREVNVNFKKHDAIYDSETLLISSALFLQPVLGGKGKCGSVFPPDLLCTLEDKEFQPTATSLGVGTAQATNIQRPQRGKRAPKSRQVSTQPAASAHL